MADKAPDKKDIQDAQIALDKYNDALRESANYAKELSKQVGKLPESFNFSEIKNKELVKGIDNYTRTLQKTLDLSDKIGKGKATEKDVTKQLGEIQRKYDEYRAANAASFESKRGRFVLAQKKAQEEIDNIEKAQLERRNKVNSAYRTLDIIQEKIIEAEARAASTSSSTQKKLQLDRIKFLKNKAQEEKETIAVGEKELKNSEKTLSQKKKEKDEVDKIIEVHKNITKGYEKQIKDNEAISAALKQQNTLFNKTKDELKGIGDKIKDNVKSALSLSSIFEYLKKVALGASDNVTKLQKGLVLSREEAYNVRQEFNDIAVASGDAAINTTRLVEANAELGKQLGFASKFTDDINIQFVKLTKQIGLSEEAAGGLAKLSVATGKTLKESKNIALETTQRLSAQYGIQLNQREVLEEVGKISGQTLAMFKGSVPALTQAVAQAKLLGTNLETTKKQASALLNFESSIENELQAELLTGQQLNLERARTAALMGDMTTVMEELNNQNIDFNKFSNMNVIAQEKVASALGLSSDELSDQLFKQQYLGRSVEEVAALEGEEVAKRLEALNAQDKFNLAMEKMQDIVAKIVGGGLGQLADLIANMAKSSGVLFGVLTAIAGISLAKTVMSLALMSAQLKQSAIAGAATSAFLNPVNLAIGVAALAVTVGLLSSMFSDAESVGDMSYSKGKTLISTKEGGLFEPSLNDDIAVAPGIGDIIGNSQKSTIVAQDNSELLTKFDALLAKTEQTNTALNKINNKEAKIQIGAQQVGTAQMMFNTNLA